MAWHGPRGSCGCCGCVIKSQQLFPDFYSPEDITCFKRYRERISIATLTTQLTQTWVDSVLTNDTATLVDTDDITDVTTDTVTTDNRAGKFEWVFPQVEIPFGDFVIESTTGEVGVNGTRTYVPRTRIRTNRTVWEEYRLIVRYDVSNQFNFGREDDASADILKAANVTNARTAHTIDGWVGSTGQTNTITVKGLRPDAVAPTTDAEFDTLWAISESSTTQSIGTGSFSFLSWLPTTATDDIYFLFFSDTNKRGLNVTPGSAVIWDRTATALPATPYDWSKHWVREDYNQWRTAEFLPADNYQISLNDLLPDGFWNTEGRELEFSFVQLGSGYEGGDDILIKQRFFVSIGDTISGTSTREWRIRSDGHWGVIDHAIDVRSQTAFPVVGLPPFPGNWGPSIKVRGSVYELIGESGISTPNYRQGGRRSETGVDAYYEWVPYWHGFLVDDSYYGETELDPPRFYLRIKITSDNPQQNEYNETGLQHIDDEKKLTCPDNYTCSIIDDYAHPEFRLISQSLPSLSPVFSPSSTEHTACQSLATTEAPIDPITFNWDVSEYVHQLIATYGPSVDNWWSVNSTVSRDIGDLIVFTEDTTTSWDISGPKHLTITVKVNDYFATHTRSGLPPYAGPLKHGQKLLITSGSGDGLVFLVDVEFEVDETDFSYNFTCSNQAYIPVLDISELDTAGIAATLGSAVYWVQGLDGMFYSLSSSGVLSDFFETPGIAIPDSVDVQVIYTLDISAAPQEEEPFASDFPPPDNTVSYFRHSGGTPYEFSDTFIDGLPAPITAPTYDTPPASAPGGGTLDATEENHGYRYSRFQINGGAGSLGDFANTYQVSFEFIKQVARWRDREAPTIHYSSVDLLKEVVDYEVEEIGGSITKYKLYTEFIRGTEVEFIAQHESQTWAASFFESEVEPAIDVLNETFTIRYGTVFPSGRLQAGAVMKYTREVHDAEDITFTIGPSTYVPPAPL